MVTPSALTVNDAELPATMVGTMFCAPVALYWIVATSATPSGSVAERFTVTSVLFKPAALGAGEMVIEVLGGEVSTGADPVSK